MDAGKSTLSAAIIMLQHNLGLASLALYEEIDKAPEEKASHRRVYRN
jgi:translation elongation factor EF-Tu-like GTPase